MSEHQSCSSGSIEVPKGWKLVPERATQRQMDAGLYQSSADSTWADVYSIYADMIDVAPSIEDGSEPVADPRPVAQAAQEPANGGADLEYAIAHLRAALTDIDISAFNAAKFRIGRAVIELTGPTRTFPSAQADSGSSRLYLDRSEVRSILIGQPDENLHITEQLLCEMDALPIITAGDLALSAVTPSPGPGEWQPIEAAPRDGTRILLFKAGRGAFEGWWHKAWPHPEEYWMDDADSEPDPTHWRPTLPLPSTDREGDK